MIALDGRSLTLERLVAIADDAAPVALGPDARSRVSASRAVVDRLADGDAPVYGINTGFGSFAEVKIPRGDLARLQLNLLRSHAAGVGEPLPVRTVRAIMALRANVLARGFSGIRLETLETLETSAPLARVHARVRAAVPPLDDDRPPSPDLEAVAALISAGALETAAGVPVK